jgi:serine/threonine-protein kinase HipA
VALTESDYLLGVYDETRLGAIRFSHETNGPFLSSGTDMPAPPWTTLRALEAASLAFENDEDSQEEKWLQLLIAPGSSIGGARPKASVQAQDGSLWIAKFPSMHDEWNSGAWEIVVHDLAVVCGLNVPEAKLATFSEKGGTFLVKRFDRDGDRRIHFSSSMALLGRTDGEGSAGASYLDIASFIRSAGASPKQDLKELWKRIVFNMAVSNTDDHLRNHGFILTDHGWRLSPIFDVNPNIYGNTLSLNIDEYDNSVSFELAVETSGYYDIDAAEAEKVVIEIQETINKNWRDIALRYGLGKGAIERMEPAFSLKYR